VGCGGQSAATSQHEIPILLNQNWPKDIENENENDLSLLVDTENSDICFVPFTGGHWEKKTVL
jgi:hypothetical protein